MFTPEQTEALAAPLNAAHVASRKQGGAQVSYIAGWHAIAEANRIFGFDGWWRETLDLRQLGEPRQTGETARVGYSCRVRITVRKGDELIIRDGCGFGSGIDRDVHQAHESALKEAETDAMKRALMTFGNPFGLALYDKTQANVEAAPPPGPSAKDMAIQTLRACKTAAEFKDAWEKGHEGWKAVMTEGEYRHVQTVKVEMVAKLKPREVAAESQLEAAE